MLRSDRSSRAALTWTALAVTSAALLTGCAPGDADPSASPSPSASATSEPTPAPTETAAPEETSPPFAIACDALLTLDQLYAFNPNVSADPGYTPSSASITAVVDEGGTACGYVNQTSGEVIEVAVATPTASVLEAMAGAAAETSTPVPTYGTPPEVEGYFMQSGNTGRVQVFRGPYWIVMESALLFEPGDAEPLVSAVLGNLPAA